MAAERGCVRIATIRGVPLHVHWSAVLVVFVVFTWRVSLGALVGMVAILLAHEAGHAVFVRWRGLTPVSIVLTGIGGECRYVGDADAYDTAFIAWGGVFAQVLLLVATLGCGYAVPEARLPVLVRDALWMLIVANAAMIALNLLPVRPLDGAKAWRIAVVRPRSRSRPTAGWARAQQERARRRR
jgi:Zn-dependent protease